MEPYEESSEPNRYPQFPKILNKRFTDDKLRILQSLLWPDGKQPTADLKIGVNKKSLIEIVDMVERRRVYLHVFHRIEMSEYNEFSLYCFWILKCQPFFPNFGHNGVTSEINATLAYRLLINCVRAIRKEKGKVNPVCPKQKLMIHAFRYQDISKEAIMLLMENLIESTD